MLVLTSTAVSGQTANYSDDAKSLQTPDTGKTFAIAPPPHLTVTEATVGDTSHSPRTSWVTGAPWPSAPPSRKLSRICSCRLRSSGALVTAPLLSVTSIATKYPRSPSEGWPHRRIAQLASSLRSRVHSTLQLRPISGPASHSHQRWVTEDETLRHAVSGDLVASPLGFAGLFFST